MVVAIIGILAAIAVPNMLTALQRAKQKRTMASMRSLATAWEARATEIGAYNAAGAGFSGASALITSDDVVTMLEPTYIKTAQVVDGWQRPMRFYLDHPMGGAAAERYVIHSAGRDGIFDDAPATGIITDFDCDLVYSNGTFLSYPPQ